MKTQLLCTFTKKTELNETVDVIISCNEIMFEKIYVFENSERQQKDCRLDGALEGDVQIGRAHV